MKIRANKAAGRVKPSTLCCCCCKVDARCIREFGGLWLLVLLMSLIVNGTSPF